MAQARLLNNSLQTGGDGFTARAYGLAIDSLRAMDVVLANGSLVHATPTSYPDVFFVRILFGLCFSFSHCLCN